MKSGREVNLTLTSPVFQSQVQFHLANTKCRASDNFFDLCPDVAHVVTVKFDEELSHGEVTRRLSAMSMVDSYA